MKTSEKNLVTAITLGSMFEWFDIFLYEYWAPLMSASFFHLTLPLAELIYAAVILGTGLIARPLGGLLFGYIGDKWGRRISFLISIAAIVVPSLAVAFTPSFSSWAYGSLIYIGLMRFLQGIPAGGELPGALCMLAESGNPERRRYLCSYLLVGPQIGQILSMLLCLSLERMLTHEELISWGWRLSFLVGGIIGIVGFFIRRKLHETISFAHLKSEHKIEQHPLKKSFKFHKKAIVTALFISIFEVIGFFTINFYLFEHSDEILKLDHTYSILIYALYLVVITILTPIIGSINKEYKSRSLLKLSAIGVMLFSFPFYLAISNGSTMWIFILLSIIILFYCIQFSILPSFIAGLFPTAVRFTCIGFSFNITDGVIGGAVHDLSDWIIETTGRHAGIAIVFPISALIFLICLRFVKEKTAVNKSFG